MKPIYHLIVSGMLAMVLYPYYGVYSFLALLGGFLIDTDHYIFYVTKKRDFSIKRMYEYCIDSTYNKIFCIFHNIEFFLLLVILNILIPDLFPLTLSVLVHFMMDLTNIYRKGTLKKEIRAFSLIARLI